MFLKSEFTLFQNSALSIDLSHVIPLILSNTVYFYPPQNVKFGSFTSWLCRDGKECTKKDDVHAKLLFC